MLGETRIKLWGTEQKKSILMFGQQPYAQCVTYVNGIS